MHREGGDAEPQGEGDGGGATDGPCSWPRSNVLFLAQNWGMSLVSQFCGQEDTPACTEAGLAPGEAYAIALRNLERYELVGLGSHFELSVCMLSLVAPRFFSSHGLQFPRTVVNASPESAAQPGTVKSLSWAAVQTLLKQPWNRHELAFYSAVATRFWDHVDAIGATCAAARRRGATGGSVRKGALKGARPPGGGGGGGGSSSSSSPASRVLPAAPAHFAAAGGAAGVTRPARVWGVP